MKRLFQFGLIALLSLTLFSCTKTIYTHQQSMSALKTKKDIVSVLGLPTEKKKDEGIEEWIYDYGNTSVSRNYGDVSSQGSAYNYGNRVSASINTTGDYVNTFSTYKKYIKFTIDDKGNVINWQSQGVDYSIKKFSLLKTMIYITVLMAVIVGTVAAANSGNGN